MSDDAAVSSTLAAATAMHRAFHIERQYVAKNLCPCKGCAAADNLKLKFVAHIGDVATQKIRQQRKLVGIDVILAHRMLKNTRADSGVCPPLRGAPRARGRGPASPRPGGPPGPRGDRSDPGVLPGHGGPPGLGTVTAGALCPGASREDPVRGGRRDAVHAGATASTSRDAGGLILRRVAVGFRRTECRPGGMMQRVNRSRHAPDLAARARPRRHRCPARGGDVRPRVSSGSTTRRSARGWRRTRR